MPLASPYPFPSYAGPSSSLESVVPYPDSVVAGAGVTTGAGFDATGATG